MNKSCLECNETVKGRSDKKFCSDLCRNAYNNKRNSDTNNYVRNVNTILRKNRRILEAILLKDAVKANKNKLLQKGFNFQYYTSTHITRKNTKYYFCYEYGYLPLENDFYFLMKRKEDSEQ